MPWPRFQKTKLSAVQTPGGKGITCRKETEGGSCRGPLPQLPLGQCAVVHHVDLDENSDKRLRTLGICPGRRVWMVRKGDPMVVRVMGTRIGLAAELAQGVTVEVCATPHLTELDEITPVQVGARVSEASGGEVSEGEATEGATSGGGISGGGGGA